MEDRYGALFRSDVTIHPLGVGPLAGWTFMAKDNIDVADYVTSCGNPDWLRTHDAALNHADVIRSLLHAGATLTGKTHTDELMYSLNGENAHYGTPQNPRAPGRVPGGSSSGSAVAIAAEMADFALGTDTGGSVRIPSSYCGVYGIRPSHGRLSTAGVVKLAPSFCTVGWMANTANRLARVGEVLFSSPAGQTYAPYGRCVVPIDALALVDMNTRQAFMTALSTLSKWFQEVEFVTLSEEGLDLWLWAFRTIQSREVWQTHGAWIERVQPQFGPGIAERFLLTQTVTADMAHLATQVRKTAVDRLQRVLGTDTLLMIPTAPGIAPPLNWNASDLDAWRTRAMQLTCVAGLAGLPQVTMPLLEERGCPVGLSVIGAAGDDERLLHLVEGMTTPTE